MKTLETRSPDWRPAPDRAKSEAAQPTHGRKKVEGNAPLHVLIVEDREDDALLLGIELERSGYQPVCQRVESSAAMSAALEERTWELIIADYRVPGFGGLQALELVKAKRLDLPFIIVSGVIQDHEAVEAMKAGAHDYIMKGNLARLGPAVQRELRDAQVRRERRRSDEKLKAEQVFREAIENSVPAGIAVVDLEGRQTYVNPAFCGMVGWSESELVGARPPFKYWPPEQIEAIQDALAEVIEKGLPAGGLELSFRRRSGDHIQVLLQVTPLKDTFGNIAGWVSSATDISERKRAETRLATEHGITSLLGGTSSLDEAMPRILDNLLHGLNVDAGRFWAVAPSGRCLTPSLVRQRTASPALEAFFESGRALELPRGGGLPGRVWQERRALWSAALTPESNVERHDLAVAAGLHSTFAFPIQNADNFFGVVELLSLRRLGGDPALVNMITAIGYEIGQSLQRRKAEEELRRAHDELELRVEQRTAELGAANLNLRAAIADRKRLENELLDITERERRRIGLDLHDDLGQKLSGIALMTKGLELKLTKQGLNEAAAAAKIHTLVQETMSHASDLAHDLATLDLPKKELPEALQELAARARELFHISCQFAPAGSMPVLERTVVMQIYKIAQEAVTNAIKHGKSKRVGITLANGAGNLVLTVQNNGLPFPDLRSESTGMGLRIMNYRASLIGAVLAVKGVGSRGTVVTCTLPLGPQVGERAISAVLT